MDRSKGRTVFLALLQVHQVPIMLAGFLIFCVFIFYVKFSTAGRKTDEGRQTSSLISMLME